MSAKKMKIVLWFLGLEPKVRTELLRPYGIRELKFKKLKTSEEGLARRNRSRQKRSRDPIHSDFEALMAVFEVDLEAGTVGIAGTDRKPSKLKSGYLLHTVKGRSYLVHRLIMMKKLGRHLVPGEEVDHINMRKDDNRLSNLRVMTPKANKAAWQSIRRQQKYI
jgi:hypothetical protein